MANILFSQSYNENYSVIPHGIVQDNDGNYIFVGRAFTSNSVSSGFATKITPDGFILWNNTYSQPFTQFFSSIAKLNDGTFVATGSYFYSQYSGDEYVWVVRFDSDGNIIFQDALGGVGIQSDGISVCATKDGGFAIVAILIENAVAKTAVIRYDSSNAVVWQKFFDIGAGLSITETLDGGFAIAGATEVGVTLNNNIFILRLDSNGDMLWSEVYTDYEIYVLLNADIIENKVGHFVVVAKSLIIEVDSCGNILWTKQDDRFNLSSIAELPNDNYVVSGSIIINYFDHAYITILDKTGNLTPWNNTELLYPSGFTGLIINNYGLITTCAYAPININDNQSVITVFE